jgi:hypothetical protein
MKKLNKSKNTFFLDSPPPVTPEVPGTMEAPSFGWEQYLEATEALSSDTSVGMDPKAILDQLGMTLSDYVHAGNYWGPWFTENALRDPTILAKHIELSEKYRAKYAMVENHQDIPF